MGGLRSIARRWLPAAARPLLRRGRGAAARGRRRLLYAGLARSCPCCGGRFRRFLPHGPARRPDARCPVCGSLERHRLLALFFERRPELLRPGMRLLHVAPERMLESRLRRVPQLRYLSGDLAGRGAVRLDLGCLPSADARFDAIVCNHVLEHVADDRRALRELLRVLRPGGWAVLQVPLDLQRAQSFEDAGIRDPAERARLFGQADHVRVYGRDYPERLSEVGFALEVWSPEAELAPGSTRRYGLEPGECVHLCRRPGPAGPPAR